MTLNKTLLAASIAALAFTGSVNAADESGNANANGKIQFKGQFIDTTCTIEANNSSKSEGVVQLGTWLTSVFKDNIGKKSEAVPFTIRLSNCPTMLTKARVYFKGAEHLGNTELYKVDNVAGVGIGISSDEAGTAYYPPNSEAKEIKLDKKTNSGEETYYARYQTVTAEVTEGTANADVTVTIQYNQ